MEFELEIHSFDKIRQVVLQIYEDHLRYCKIKAKEKYLGLINFDFDVSIEWHNDPEFQDYP